MRSILGRCIAIAMMAAIALAWQSPPVQAQVTEVIVATVPAGVVPDEITVSPTTSLGTAGSTAAEKAAHVAAIAALKTYARSIRTHVSESKRMAAAAAALVKDTAAAATTAKAADEAAAKSSAAATKADPGSAAAFAAADAASAAKSARTASDAARTSATSLYGTARVTTPAAAATEFFLTAAQAEDAYQAILNAADVVTYDANANPQGVDGYVDAVPPANTAQVGDVSATVTPATPRAQATTAMNMANTARIAAENMALYAAEAVAKAAEANSFASAAYANAGIATAAAVTKADTAVTTAEAAEAAAKLKADAAQAAVDANPSNTELIRQNVVAQAAYTAAKTATANAKAAAIAARAVAAQFGATTVTPEPPGNGEMCDEGMEMVEGACVAECGEGIMRDEDGMCMATCPEGETMGEDGMCMAMMPEEDMMGMQVAPGGVGDLLLFGYWTSMDSKDTLISIANTDTAMDAAVHVRIREGVNSAEVRDFRICMSGGDVWTAAITTDGAGISRLLVGNPGSGTTCTSSAVPADGMILGAAFGYLEAYTMAPMGGADTLAGTATIVSPAMGFASSYNATALVGFDAEDEAAEAISDYLKMALAREGGVDKEVLLGRWTASTGAVTSRTQIVLTFPGRGQPGADTVTAHVYDEEENDNLSPRYLTMGQEVNVCTFWNKDDTMNNRVKLECNGGDGLLTDAEQGWYRLINNAVGGDATELDNPNLPPATRFPVIALQFSYFAGTNGDFDQSYPIQWMAEMGAGAMDDMGNSAPWYSMMGGGMMVDPGDNMTGGLPIK